VGHSGVTFFLGGVGGRWRSHIRRRISERGFVRNLRTITLNPCGQRILKKQKTKVAIVFIEWILDIV